jgi:hypothetical protein
VRNVYSLSGFHSHLPPNSWMSPHRTPLIKVKVNIL